MVEKMVNIKKSIQKYGHRCRDLECPKQILLGNGREFHFLQEEFKKRDHKFSSMKISNGA